MRFTYRKELNQISTVNIREKGHIKPSAVYGGVMLIKGNHCVTKLQGELDPSPFCF